ncbi:MAG: GABA permease, partial [Burkholderia sp.]|nr:GABA permease [Burkholderia sp.]
VKMWAYPYLTWVAIIGMIGILVAMAFIPDQRKPLWLGVASLGVLVVAYGLTRRSRREHLDDSELLAYPPR